MNRNVLPMTNTVLRVPMVVLVVLAVSVASMEQVVLAESRGGRAQVTASLTWRGEALSVTVEVS